MFTFLKCVFYLCGLHFKCGVHMIFFKGTWYVRRKWLEWVMSIVIFYSNNNIKLDINFINWRKCLEWLKFSSIYSFIQQYRVWEYELIIFVEDHLIVVTSYFKCLDESCWFRILSIVDNIITRCHLAVYFSRCCSYV